LFAETFADQDLLVLDSFRGIRVLTPSAFWKWESRCDRGTSAAQAFKSGANCSPEDNLVE